MVEKECVIVGEREAEVHESFGGGAEAIHHNVIDISEGSEDGVDDGWRNSS